MLNSECRAQKQNVAICYKSILKEKMIYASKESAVMVTVISKQKAVVVYSIFWMINVTWFQNNKIYLHIVSCITIIKSSKPIKIGVQSDPKWFYKT